MARRRPASPRGCSPRTKPVTAGISTHSTADERIRQLRPPKPFVDPWRAHGAVLDDERTANGSIERSLTVFLAGAECPFTCSFCDLWRWTLDGATPRGALTLQLGSALEGLRPPFPDRLKLYNASNFFDRRAVPVEDLPAIAELAQPFNAVTVESHANMVGMETRAFAALLSGRLEVAIGLETVHPGALAQLNKRLDLATFDRATAFLAEHHIDVRVFVLLGVPHVSPGESIEWTVRTIEHAAARGASRIVVIPVRGGNGELERLQALGAFVPPTLAQLEQVLDCSLAIKASAVSADLWDIERLPGCEACRGARVARLGRMNLTGRSEPPVVCRTCA